MPRDVFVSYSHEDQAAAEQLAANLERQNISCWIAPRDIEPGAPWAASIEDAMRRCRNFVLVLSGSTQHSRQVPRELELADVAGLQLIAFRIEDVEPPPGLRFFLSNVQRVDAFNHHFAGALARLTSAIVQDKRYPAEKTQTTRIVSPIVPEPKAPPPRLVRLLEIAAATLLTIGIGSATYQKLQKVEASEKFEQAKSKVEEGDGAYGQKKYCAALQAYTAALAVDHNLYQAYCKRARIYQRQGQDQKARADLATAARVRHVGSWDQELADHPLPRDLTTKCRDDQISAAEAQSAENWTYSLAAHR